MTRISRSPLLLLFLPLLAACGEEMETLPSAEFEEGTRPARGQAWVIFQQEAAVDTVVAEVAATPAERERGLMGRTELSEGEGMLFVFEEQAPRSFWMRNTVIPLDIAFLDQRQVVVDIQQMEPLDETFTESAAPAMFALEVPQGWFEAQGVQEGSQARIVFGRR